MLRVQSLCRTHRECGVWDQETLFRPKIQKLREDGFFPAFFDSGPSQPRPQDWQYAYTFRF